MTNLEYYKWDHLNIDQYDIADDIVCCRISYKGKHLKKNDEIILKSFMCHVDSLNEMKVKWLLEEYKQGDYNDLLTDEDRRLFKHCVSKKKQFCFE